MSNDIWPKVALVITDGGWADMIDALELEHYQVIVKTSVEEAVDFLRDVNPYTVLVGMAISVPEQRELFEKLHPCPKVMLMGPDTRKARTETPS